MRAVRLTALNVVGLEHVPEPVPGEGDLIVRVAAAGMCGSDRHILSGDYPSAPPVTLGHEVEGLVVGGGSGSPVPMGSRVAIDPNISCLQCRFCRAGLFSHCTQAYALPDDLPLGYGALCEPLACCLRATDHADCLGHEEQPSRRS
jgi:L-iditol 2-dehydrogenase